MYTGTDTRFLTTDRAPAQARLPQASLHDGLSRAKPPDGVLALSGVNPWCARVHRRVQLFGRRPAARRGPNRRSV